MEAKRLLPSKDHSRTVLDIARTGTMVHSNYLCNDIVALLCNEESIDDIQMVSICVPHYDYFLFFLFLIFFYFDFFANEGITLYGM